MLRIGLSDVLVAICGLITSALGVVVTVLTMDVFWPAVFVVAPLSVYCWLKVITWPGWDEL